MPHGTCCPAAWPTREWAALGSSPIVNVHVIYDRRVLDDQFAAARRHPGAVGVRPDRRVRAASWPGGAQYLAVSLSAADDLITAPVARIRDELLPALAALLPRRAAGRRCSTSS